MMAGASVSADAGAESGSDARDQPSVDEKLEQPGAVRPEPPSEEPEP